MFGVGTRSRYSGVPTHGKKVLGKNGIEIDTFEMELSGNGINPMSAAHSLASEFLYTFKISFGHYQWALIEACHLVHNSV